MPIVHQTSQIASQSDAARLLATNVS
jgi:hypothetical protein